VARVAWPLLYHVIAGTPFNAGTRVPPTKLELKLPVYQLIGEKLSSSSIDPFSRNHLKLAAVPH